MKLASAADLQPSEAALNLLWYFEKGPGGGFASVIYRDWAGHETIGWGHRVRPGERFPQPISAAEADALLRQDLESFARGVRAGVRVPITQSMFDALCCFVFNLGKDALIRSTLLRFLNKARYADAADQFTIWNKATNPTTGKKEPLAGLSRRRMAEKSLFLREGWPE